MTVIKIYKFMICLFFSSSSFLLILLTLNVKILSSANVSGLIKDLFPLTLYPVLICCLSQPTTQEKQPSDIQFFLFWTKITDFQEGELFSFLLR